MLIAAYIVLAIAFGINLMLLFHRCMSAVQIRLSHGLVATLVIVAIQTGLFMLGMLFGNLLRFELPEQTDAFARTNALVCMGLTVFVAVRSLLPYLRREPRLPLFKIALWMPVVGMALATGINHFLLGLGCGFVASLSDDFHKVLWPMLVLQFLIGYWGLMLGRQKVKIRPRRWEVVAVVLMIGVAVAAVVNS